ncbi:class I SAM-dependent methyltransferase [Amycolatopsis sp. NPDC051102]|uniref:class I SAM-dependent methyltransferase n=1 Tax=Amycolatopsis sp. NPDC051102 TaxID=3155163 RepID=UPI0034149323
MSTNPTVNTVPAPSPAMPRDEDLYCVVGPELHLVAARPRGADRIDFEVLDDRETCLGSVRAGTFPGGVELVPDGALRGSAATTIAEAVRLAVRTAAKAFRDGLGEWRLNVPEPLGAALLPLLSEEGFEPAASGGLRSTRRDFTRGAERADSMEGVYEDPYTVPWNFVPLEADVLDRLTAVAPPGARVLDLGCGYGKNARRLTGAGYRVAGADISASAVARARRLVGPEVPLVAADATELPWPDASFDVALDIGCLHCMPAGDRPAAARELARVLTGEGVLCSRMFLPRPAGWVAAQPFRTTEFGLTAEEAAALLGSAFAWVELERTDEATYLVARGPVQR